MRHGNSRHAANPFKIALICSFCTPPAPPPIPSAPFRAPSPPIKGPAEPLVPRRAEGSLVPVPLIPTVPLTPADPTCAESSWPVSRRAESSVPVLLTESVARLAAGTELAAGTGYGTKAGPPREKLFWDIFSRTKLRNSATDWYCEQDILLVRGARLLGRNAVRG